MNSAESILVIIVSVTLTLFLVAGIIALVLIIKVLRALKRVIDQAERVVERAGDAAEVLRNTSGPLALFKVIRNIVRTVERSRK